MNGAKTGRRAGRAFTSTDKNLDYNGFIKRTEGIKHLFLATSLTVNLFVNVKLFDMIIIDDAHLLSAEDIESLEGHQLVIAGEQQLQSAVTNNLIARIHPSRMIQFNYRFADADEYFVAPARIARPDIQ